jgi:hypothetical protein
MPDKKFRTIRKLTIDRSRWYSYGNYECPEIVRQKAGNRYPSGGDLYYHPELLTPAGNMCCLGFACRRAGATKADLQGRVSPGSIGLIPLFVDEDEDSHGLYYNDSDLSDNAMKINDDDNIPRSEKERLLVKLFAEHGVELTFQ